MAGIPNPLEQLPTLYALIDVVEIMILDSMEKQEEREQYRLRMYAPPPGSSLSGALPKGWSDEEEIADSDAAAKALGLA